jgi:hypothetical protein
MRTLLPISLFVLAWSSVVAADRSGANALSKRIDGYMEAASVMLATEQRNTLARIQDKPRRFLALTYYVRAGDSIAARWTWNAEQINAYEESDEYREMLAEVAKVTARFAAENPPYILYANTQVRSLEQQIKTWHSVHSIDAAARELQAAAVAECLRTGYPITPTRASKERFIEFLSSWRASSPPTLAAPGLSLHGRSRAFDFQILDANGQTIAGVNSATVATIWDGNGWTERLSRAVHAASEKFVGPLAAPREPWHYEFQPADANRQLTKQQREMSTFVAK